MPDPHFRPETVAVRRSTGDPVGPVDGERSALEILAAPELDEVGGGIDAGDVAPLAEGHPEARSLADGGGGHAAMLAQARPVGVDQGTRRLLPPRSFAQEGPIVAVGHE